jgi:predicted  nucleic acid-binding Zn-ribbon protein
MTFDFRYPQLTGATEREQLQQMKTYIHQLVDELKWALNSVGSPQGNVVVIQQKSGNANSGIGTIGMDELNEDSVQAHFNEIKPLIIKSADIVNAYYEEINKRLESLYVAQSEFGTFVQQATQDIEATADNVTQVFTNVQTIATDVGTVKTEVQTIDSKVKSIDNNLATVQTNYSNVTSKVQNIDSSVQNIDSKVTTIDTELKTVGDNVGTLDTELESVKTGVQAVEQKAQAIEGEVQAISTNVQDIETNLQDTKVGIGSNLDSLSEEVGLLDDDLQGVKDGLDANLQVLTDEVGQLDTRLEDAKSEIDSDLQTLKDDIESLNYSIIEVNANIKSGLLYYDENEVPVYGLEIGQRNVIDGVEVFNKYARFTSDRLSFYDQNDTEVAYISDKKLYIANVEVLNSYKIGGFVDNVLSDYSVVTKWVTGGEG